MELQTDIQDHPSYPVVQQAISGQETIRWIGKPDPLHAIRKTWIVSLFGLFFGTVAYFIISNMMSFNRGFSLSTTTGPSSSFRLIGFFIASVFVVIVIRFVFAPLWEYLIAIGRVYAITNERALIISHFPSIEQRSFYPGDIKYVQVKGKGVGDVIFDSEMKTVTQYKKKPGSDHQRMVRRKVKVEIGFLSIPNPTNASALLLALKNSQKQQPQKRSN